MRELWTDESGLTTVEYALLLALIVVAGITAWRGLGTTVRGSVANADATINGAATP